MPSCPVIPSRGLIPTRVDLPPSPRYFLSKLFILMVVACIVSMRVPEWNARIETPGTLPCFPDSYIQDSNFSQIFGKVWRRVSLFTSMACVHPVRLGGLTRFLCVKRRLAATTEPGLIAAFSSGLLGDQGDEQADREGLDEGHGCVIERVVIHLLVFFQLFNFCLNGSGGLHLRPGASR